MFRERRRERIDVSSFLKTALAAGIVIITISLTLFLTDKVASFGGSWQIQVLVAGGVVMVMAYLSLKIYDGL